MAIESGFFNSVGGDRKYNTRDWSRLFDGLIIDGVFASVGTAFVANAYSSNDIHVGIGKAWYNSSWLWNSSILTITMPASDLILNRIDAIVLDFNDEIGVRANDILVVQGTPATNPNRPTLINTDVHKQKPVCYIYREANSTSIRQADITNMIGSDDNPFVLGVLSTVNIEELIGQWEDRLDKFVEDETEDFTNWRNDSENEYNQWFDALKADLLLEQAALDQWIQNEQNDFTTWFNLMKDQLSSDAAGYLNNQIARIDATAVFEGPEY